MKHLAAVLMAIFIAGSLSGVALGPAAVPDFHIQAGPTLTGYADPLAIPTTTLALTRTPTPTRSSRPFPAPVTTATYSVPGSIDATGATDVTAALNAYIASVPDGSQINFQSGGTYSVSNSLLIGGRNNLILNGNGCTIKFNPGSSTDNDSIWADLGASGSHITVEDFVLIGSSTTPGLYVPGAEGQHGVLLTSDYVEATGNTISAVWGDGLFVEISSNAWFHKNHVVSAGRNGQTVISGTNVLIEQNAFDKSGYVTFDDEPYLSSQTSANITFRDNTAGTWGQDFAAVDGSHTGAPINGITVSGNTDTGGTLLTNVDNGGALGTVMQNIVFTNNTSTVAGNGPLLMFAHISGLTITGNVQPLISGSLARITDSTGVTKDFSTGIDVRLPVLVAVILAALAAASLLIPGARRLRSGRQGDQ